VPQRFEQHDGKLETPEHDGTDHDLFADKERIHRFSSPEERGKGRAPGALSAMSFRL